MQRPTVRSLGILPLMDNIGDENLKKPEPQNESII